ncbi:hypothetical protein DFAR_1100005 [Desulfarculales bacterium]
MSMAAITTISPKWPATCRQPSRPSSAKAVPASTSLRKATSVRAAQWRIIYSTRHALKYIVPETKFLPPILRTLMILEEHAT